MNFDFEVSSNEDPKLKKVEISRILRLLFRSQTTIRFENLRMAFLLSKELSSSGFVFSAQLILMVGVMAQEPSSLAQKELERRQASVDEAQMLLLKGDEAYASGKYEEAVAAYSGAQQLFPDSPATTELRSAALQRYAQASVELAKEMSRKGDVAGAKSTMDKVLADGIAPNDPEAIAYRAQLDDPIRTNPALTKEHAADVDQVRRLLYTAQGAFDLGKYDEAETQYQKILGIDKHNTAARRGMELIAVEKSRYYKSAFDQTRADALGEVDSAWELPLAQNLVIPTFESNSETFGQSGDLVPISNKLSRIVIPKFFIQDGSILEAVELLRLRSVENDTLTLDPDNKGFNIILNLGDPSSSPAKEILAKTFDLQVENVPVEEILRYICEITGTTYRPDDFAVTITPSGSSTNEMTSRTYRVPPDFLSNLTSGKTQSSEPEDVFNTEVSSQGLLATRMGVQEALAQQGVSFPDGASASYNASTNTLRVVNTFGNQDIIQQIIDSIAQTEPVSVAVRVTMVKVEQNVLEELGFDWMLSPFGLTSNTLSLSGGTTGNGSPIDDMPAFPTGVTPPINPITAGNRSGTDAILPNSIDALLGSSSLSAARVRNRAPGVLAVNGALSDTAVQAMMRGLNQNKGTDIMAQPSVTTRSGMTASIQLIQEFIYPTEYEPPELPNSVGTIGGGIGIGGGGGGGFPVTPATPTAFEKRDVGITLEVLPVADANRQYVDITLTPSVSSFSGFVNYGSPIFSTSQGILGPIATPITDNSILMPVFDVRKTNTNVVVADGATIVIAGLLKEEITDVQDKTPILGDIPVVGRLFQSDVKQHISTVVLFFVNVELVDPTGRPFRDR